MRYLGLSFAFLALLLSISAAPDRLKLEADDTSVIESCREIFNTSCEGLVPPSPKSSPLISLATRSEIDCECVSFHECSGNTLRNSDDEGETVTNGRRCPDVLQVCCQKSDIVLTTDENTPASTT